MALSRFMFWVGDSSCKNQFNATHCPIHKQNTTANSNKVRKRTADTTLFLKRLKTQYKAQLLPGALGTQNHLKTIPNTNWSINYCTLLT